MPVEARSLLSIIYGEMHLFCALKQVSVIAAIYLGSFVMITPWELYSVFVQGKSQVECVDFFFILARGMDLCNI